MDTDSAPNDTTPDAAPASSVPDVRDIPLTDLIRRPPGALSRVLPGAGRVVPVAAFNASL